MAPPAEPADDEAFLDQAFDRAFASTSDGRVCSLDDLVGERVHLRERVIAVMALARQLAVQRPPELPSVPGYRVLSLLGRGGMGAVWLAHHERLHRDVALKLLPAGQLGLARGRERFLREARALARISNPHVVAIHDVIETDGLCCYAMELVRGRTLAQVIEWRRRNPEHDLPALRAFLGSAAAQPGDGSVATFLVRTAIAIAGALAAVHQAGLLHRDVKPGNILLRSDGTPLLSDFGLVHDPGAGMETRTGQLLGTEAYAPPEQVRGDPGLDARADVYALGVTLYEAVTLRLPHQATTRAAASRSREQGLAPPGRVPQRLPRDLDTILLTALAPERDHRYPTARAFAEDLQRLIELRPILARPPGMLTRARKWVRRHRAAVLGATASSLCVLVTALVVLQHQLATAARPQQLATQLQRARLAVLYPGLGSWLYRVERSQGGGPGGKPFADLVGKAAAEYAALERLTPLPAAVADEALVVRLVAATAQTRRPPAADESLRLLAARCSTTARSFDALLREQGTTPASRLQVDLEQLLPADRRALGLLAYLARDLELTVRCWQGLDLEVEPDPLVEGALGLLRLARNEPALAYPRLLTAQRAFPQAGFLAVAVADAALQCHDLEVAQRFLECARHLQLQDPFGTAARVTGDLFRRQGRVDDAIAQYQEALVSTNGYHPIAGERLIDVLLEAGRHEAAVRAALRLPPVPRVPSDVVWRALCRWWDGLGSERPDVVVRALCSDREMLQWLRLLLLGAAAHPHEESGFVGRWRGHLLLLQLAMAARPLAAAACNQLENTMRALSASRPLTPPTLLLASLLGLVLAPGPFAQAPVWTRAVPFQSPGSRTFSALAYDSLRARTMLFGGADYLGGQYLDDLWEWNGSNWSARTTNTHPPARRNHAMAFDSGRNRLVLFGGTTNGGYMDDTWEFDGTDWVQRLPQHVPPNRTDSALAYDPVRARTVMFGGVILPLTFRGDTWEWDGTDWLQQQPQHNPAPRTNHVMAYDPIRARVVMCRGDIATGSAQDLWEWDGTDWQLRSATSPAPGGYGVFVWHAARQRLVLFGGLTNETWGWDGAQWACECPAISPSPRRGLGMGSYHAATSKIVFHGGDNGSGPGSSFDETWEYTLGAAALTSTFGQGCAGSIGVPNLQAMAAPVVGATFRARLTNVVPGAAIFVIGWSDAQWGPFTLPQPLQVFGLGPGCTGYTSVDVGVWVFQATGVADYALNIPCNAAFHGAILYLQGASIDPALPHAIPIAVSNGLRVNVGS